MCGFAGILGFSNSSRGVDDIEIMSKIIAHRGPDAQGRWIDCEQNIFLAHQRLAIIDVTEAGKQPMISKTGRYVIVFNGEIYNNNELRKELEAHSVIKWDGSSDTETLLEAIEVFGINLALTKLVGMFAIGILDRYEKNLLLVRDRIGEKPLYFGWSSSISKRLAFASEIKAIVNCADFNKPISVLATQSYLRYGYVLGDQSIYSDVFRVEPGQVVLFNLKGELIKKWYYWSFTAVALESLKSPLPDNASVTTEAVHKVLMTAVKGQMSSDVPIGAFLSGGVDSSTVVAMMQAQSAKPIQTFSIGFANKKYDESGYARQVAAHLGCDHSELIVSATEAIAVVPRIPLIYDEPLADPSQIPTVLVSQMARKKVTVALSGDGGDEVFAGYSRYHGVLREWGIISKIPRLARSLALKTVCSESINGIATILESVSIPKRSKYSFLRLLDRLGKASANLGANSIYEYYDARLQVFKEPNNILNAEWLKGSSGNSNVGIKSVSYDTDIDPLLYMQIFDTLRYLPEAILVKVDRAAMAVSLETRVPFLDHRVIDVAWRIPVKGRIGKNSGKIVLKQVLSKYVPQRIIDRPKMGFGIPVCEWLKGPLKDWAEYLLSKPCIGEVGVFRFEPINRMWHEHQSGIRQWHYQLWTVIMFQAWRLESLKFKSLI